MTRHAGVRLDPYGPHGPMLLPGDLVMLPPGPAQWMRDAACAAKPELPWTVDRARLDEYNRKILARICRDCPVHRACAAYADDHDINAGFWAGTVPRPPPPRPGRRRLPGGVMTTTAPVPGPTGRAPAAGCPAPVAAPAAASVQLVEVVAELTEAMHAYEYALQYGRPVTEVRIRFLQSVEALYRIAKHGHTGNTATPATP